MHELTKDLKLGDAFEYHGLQFLALGLSSLGNIITLDVLEKRFIHFSPETIVKTIEDYYLAENFKSERTIEEKELRTIKIL